MKDARNAVIDRIVQDFTNTAESGELSVFQEMAVNGYPGLDNMADSALLEIYSDSGLWEDKEEGERTPLAEHERAYYLLQGCQSNDTPFPFVALVEVEKVTEDPGSEDEETLHDLYWVFLPEKVETRDGSVVTVDARDSISKSIVLDVFHSDIPIKNLDDYNICVYTGVTTPRETESVSYNACPETRYHIARCP